MRGSRARALPTNARHRGRNWASLSLSLLPPPCARSPLGRKLSRLERVKETGQKTKQSRRDVFQFGKSSRAFWGVTTAVRGHWRDFTKQTTARARNMDWMVAENPMEAVRSFRFVLLWLLGMTRVAAREGRCPRSRSLQPGFRGLKRAQERYIVSMCLIQGCTDISLSLYRYCDMNHFEAQKSQKPTISLQKS